MAGTGVGRRFHPALAPEPIIPSTEKIYMIFRLYMLIYFVPHSHEEKLRVYSMVN